VNTYRGTEGAGSYLTWLGRIQGEVRPIIRPPWPRAAGFQALDSLPRPGYSLFVRRRVNSVLETGDLRLTAKRKFLSLKTEQRRWWMNRGKNNEDD
jgi:hypothetical protein